MKFHYILPAALLLFAACQPKGPSQAEYDQLLAERDSISNHMNELQDIIGSVSVSLDSIDSQEGLLFVQNEDGTKATKKQIMDRIQSYKELLQRQREHLAELEKQQNSSKANIRELKSLIGRLRQEIYDKEQKISELENELATSKRDVADLQHSLIQSREQTAAVTNERDAIQRVANAQDEMLNTGYYVIGSKDALKALGFIKGVFKKKADYANLDKNNFNKVDIREFTELTISGKSPKLVTEKPASSYSLIDNREGSWTLQITDPTLFWGTSPYLIIMTK